METATTEMNVRKPMLNDSGEELVIGSAPSPLGEAGFALRGEVLVAMHFQNDESYLRTLLQKRFHRQPTQASGPAAARVQQVLARYFAGELDATDELQVDAGGTAFQAAVWAALREIPRGETRSYAQIARRVGRPSAVRAVGMTNGMNPIWLVIPCHRVIGSDGSLTGYAGGLHRKRWLLAHEQVKGMTKDLL